MSEKSLIPTIATAYILASGEAVFLRRDGSWHSDIQKAFIATDDAGMAFLQSELQAADAKAIIVDGYLIEVALEGDGTIMPRKMRERFRLNKQPTIDYLPADSLSRQIKTEKRLVA